MNPDEQIEQPDLMHQTVSAAMMATKEMVGDIQRLMSTGMPVVQAILIQHALSSMVTAVNFMAMALNSSGGVHGQDD